MQCPKCGFIVGPFDQSCPRCHGRGLPQQAPVQQPAQDQVQQAARADSGGDMLAALIFVGLMLACGFLLFKLISSVLTGEPLVAQGRFSANPIVTAPWSPMWWIGLALGMGGFLYCGYSVVQMLRKKQRRPRPLY